MFRLKILQKVVILAVIAAFTLLTSDASADQLTVSSGFMNFPSSFSAPVQVKKVLDTKTGKISLVSSVAQINSFKALEQYRQIEQNVERSKHGAMSRDLGLLVDSLGDTGEVNVVITMKQPAFQYLDKTKHSLEELRANSLAASLLQPLETTVSLLNRYSLKPNSILRQNDNVVIGKLKAKDLKKLAFDNKIWCISRYIEPKLCTLTPYSNLATSAFNPSPMPYYGQGAGVNAATFESGVWNYVVSCRNLVLSQIDAIDNVTGGNANHSNLTFTCLANAAPSANLWHYNGFLSGRTWGTYGYSPSDSGYTWIVNNGIQTLSCSVTCPEDCDKPEMIFLDDMAYRYPYPVFCNPTANGEYGTIANWQCYNAISVGNVQHLNQTHYQINGCTQTQNPYPKYGPIIDQATGAGDREMPYVVAPGIPPDNNQDTDACIDSVLVLNGTGPYIAAGICGTSFSAPICNGIAADVISADTSNSMLFMFKYWPEATRMAIMLTAQNVDGEYWNSCVDGRDGCGVISGYSAADYARKHTNVFPNNSGVPIGMGTGTKYPGDYSDLQYNIAIPSSLPSGSHLRVVLTWDSNPDTNGTENSLSDLDLEVYSPYPSFLGGSWSWDGNVEVVDIQNCDLTPNGTCQVYIHTCSIRIPSGARGQFFCYAIGWTWVKDNAD